MSEEFATQKIKLIVKKTVRTWKKLRANKCILC